MVSFTSASKLSRREAAKQINPGALALGSTLRQFALKGMIDAHVCSAAIVQRQNGGIRLVSDDDNNIIILLFPMAGPHSSSRSCDLFDQRSASVPAVRNEIDAYMVGTLKNLDYHRLRSAG